jgi:hypothetical protein
MYQKIGVLNTFSKFDFADAMTFGAMTISRSMRAPVLVGQFPWKSMSKYAMITIRSRLRNFSNFKISSTAFPKIVVPSAISYTSAIIPSTLTATAKAFGLPTPSLSYAWTRDGAPISGATGPNYVTTAADAGKAIRSVVTATSKLGSVSTTSNAVTPTNPVKNWSAPTETKRLATQTGATAAVAFTSPAQIIYATTGDQGGNLRYTNIWTASGANFASIPGAYRVGGTGQYSEGMMEMSLSQDASTMFLARVSGTFCSVLKGTPNNNWSELSGMSEEAWSGSISDDGTKIFLGSRYDKAALYTVGANSVTLTRRFAENAYAATISGDGAWTASCPTNGSVVTIRRLSDNTTSTIDVLSANIALNRDGTVLATLYQFTVSIYKRVGNVWSFKAQVYDTSYDILRDIAISPDGKTIVLVGEKNNVANNSGRIVIAESSDLEAWSIVARKTSLYGLYTANISRDGTTIAVSGGEGVVVLNKG